MKENEKQLKMIDLATSIGDKFYEDLSCASRRLSLKTQQLIFQTLKACMSSS
jgi:hypothetical protein